MKDLLQHRKHTKLDINGGYDLYPWEPVLVASCGEGRTKIVKLLLDCDEIHTGGSNGLL